MDINKLTQKSQEALQGAQTKALRFGHQEVDVEHLLLALLEQPEGLIPRLLTRMDAPAAQLVTEIERELSRRPSVSGPGAEAGKVLITHTEPTHRQIEKLLKLAREPAPRPSKAPAATR